MAIIHLEEDSGQELKNHNYSYVIFNVYFKFLVIFLIWVGEKAKREAKKKKFYQNNIVFGTESD